MGAPNKALGLAIVDDDDVYRQYIRGMLSRRGSFDFHEVSTGDALETLLARHTIDCVLLDYNLGTETGFMIKERLDNQGSSSPPVIMLTGDGRERTVIKALRMGVSDYLPKKDLRVEELVSAIGRSIDKKREERAAVLDKQRLERSSEIDLASGLYSRGFLEKRLGQLSSQAIPGEAPCALLVVDVVQLGAIIASFGVSTGERALRIFADRLRLKIRPGDVCGRLGATSFAWIIETRSDRMMLDDLCRRLEADLSFRIDDATASFQLSCRVTSLVAELSGVTPAGLLAAAEASLTSNSPDNASGDAALLARSGGVADVSPHDMPGAAARTADRRADGRQRILKRAQIVLPNLHSTIECVVRNISVGGACIRLHSVFALPAEFNLEILGSGQRRRVRSCWQNSGDVGVKYLG